MPPERLKRWASVPHQVPPGPPQAIPAVPMAE